MFRKFPLSEMSIIIIWILRFSKLPEGARYFYSFDGDVNSTKHTRKKTTQNVYIIMYTSILYHETAYSHHHFSFARKTTNIYVDIKR
jgi:hypothetical protein